VDGCKRTFHGDQTSNHRHIPVGFFVVDVTPRFGPSNYTSVCSCHTMMMLGAANAQKNEHYCEAI
jgi:hypothetical protein